jgi:hypothetical protein
MLQTVIISIVAIPLALGLVAAFGRRHLPTAAFALLVPLLGVVVYLATEGVPSFPPTRAIHKFPYALAAGGVAFALGALVVRGISGVLAALAAAIAIALPAWWMGSNILANNSQKLTVVAILGVIAIAGAFFAASRSRAGKIQIAVVPQAIFATSVAAAVVAILGGYMGMAMFNGGLAALAGGYVLIAYIRYMRGDRAAFALDGAGAFAFAWLAFMGLVTTAILAPKASTAALIAVGVTLAATPFAGLYAARVEGLPSALRPLALGAVSAIPALAGILIAGLQFAG